VYFMGCLVAFIEAEFKRIAYGLLDLGMLMTPLGTMESVSD